MATHLNHYVLNDQAWTGLLAGQRVTGVYDNKMILSNGTVLEVDRDEYDCCSSIELTKLHTVDNIITRVELRDDEDEDENENHPNYKAWITVITEAGEFTLAEADGNASNGYYLHGFALGVTINPPEEY